jgi:hypothetical protein
MGADLEFVENVLKDVESDNDVVRAFKIMILSKIASKKPYDEAERELEGLLKDLKNLKGDLKDYVEIKVKLDQAEMCLEWAGDEKKKKAKEILENVLKMIDRLLEKKDFDKDLIEFFKVLGGEVTENIKSNLKSDKSSAHHRYAGVLMDLSEPERLNDAIKHLQIAKEIYEELNLLDNALKCEGFIRRLRAIQGDYDFDEVFNKANKIKHRLDDLTYSSTVAEFLISKAVKDEFNRDHVKLLNELTPYVRRITIPMLALFPDVVRMANLTNVESLLEEFEVEVSYLLVRKRLVRALGLMEEFAREMDLEFVRLKAGESIENTTFLDPAKEIILNAPPVWSTQALARILRLYLNGEYTKAIDIAEEEAKEYSKLLSILFKELAQALREELNSPNDQRAKQKVREAFVKLFYYHF